jgi:hypothetical protein
LLLQAELQVEVVQLAVPWQVEVERVVCAQQLVQLAAAEAQKLFYL